MSVKVENTVSVRVRVRFRVRFGVSKVRVRVMVTVSIVSKNRNFIRCPTVEPVCILYLRVVVKLCYSM